MNFEVLLAKAEPVLLQCCVSLQGTNAKTSAILERVEPLLQALSEQPGRSETVIRWLIRMLSAVLGKGADISLFDCILRALGRAVRAALTVVESKQECEHAIFGTTGLLSPEVSTARILEVSTELIRGSITLHSQSASLPVGGTGLGKSRFTFNLLAGLLRSSSPSATLVSDLVCAACVLCPTMAAQEQHRDARHVLLQILDELVTLYPVPTRHCVGVLWGAYWKRVCHGSVDSKPKAPKKSSATPPTLLGYFHDCVSPLAECLLLLLAATPRVSHTCLRCLHGISTADLARCAALEQQRMEAVDSVLPALRQVVLALVRGVVEHASHRVAADAEDVWHIICLVMRLRSMTTSSFSGDVLRKLGSSDVSSVQLDVKPPTCDLTEWANTVWSSDELTVSVSTSSYVNSLVVGRMEEAVRCSLVWDDGTASLAPTIPTALERLSFLRSAAVAHSLQGLGTSCVSDTSVKHGGTGSLRMPNACGLLLWSVLCCTPLDPKYALSLAFACSTALASYWPLHLLAFHLAGAATCWLDKSVSHDRKQEKNSAGGRLEAPDLTAFALSQLAAFISSSGVDIAVWASAFESTGLLTAIVRTIACVDVSDSDAVLSGRVAQLLYLLEAIPDSAVSSVDAGESSIRSIVKCMHHVSLHYMVRDAHTCGWIRGAVMRLTRRLLELCSCSYVSDTSRRTAFRLVLNCAFQLAAPDNYRVTAAQPSKPASDSEEQKLEDFRLGKGVGVAPELNAMHSLLTLTPAQETASSVSDGKNAASIGALCRNDMRDNSVAVAGVDRASVIGAIMSASARSAEHLELMRRCLRNLEQEQLQKTAASSQQLVEPSVTRVKTLRKRRRVQVSDMTRVIETIQDGTVGAQRSEETQQAQERLHSAMNRLARATVVGQWHVHLLSEMASRCRRHGVISLTRLLLQHLGRSLIAPLETYEQHLSSLDGTLVDTATAPVKVFRTVPLVVDVVDIIASGVRDGLRDQSEFAMRERRDLCVEAARLRPLLMIVIMGSIHLWSAARKLAQRDEREAMLCCRLVQQLLTMGALPRGYDAAPAFIPVIEAEDIYELLCGVRDLLHQTQAHTLPLSTSSLSGELNSATAMTQEDSDSGRKILVRILLRRAADPVVAALAPLVLAEQRYGA